jgi:hypothetical protein
MTDDEREAVLAGQREVPAMTALGLLSRWCLDEVLAPTQPDDSRAVASLRFAQAARLPVAERDRLSRLLWQAPHNHIADAGRQKGTRQWSQ